MPDDLTVRIRAEVDAAIANMQKWNTTVNKGAVQTRDSGMAFLAAGMALQQVGTKVAGSNQKLIDSFASFDQAMANTISIAQGTSAEFAEMRKQAIELSKEGPESAQQIAAGYYQLVSAGMKANQVMGMTPALLKAAAAAGTDFTTVADVGTTVMRVWNYEASDMAEIMDVLQSAVKNAKTTMPELALSMQYAAAPASALGISLEETAAALAVVRNAGLDASVAGTGLRMTLMRLAQMAKEGAAPMIGEVEFQIVKTKDGSVDLAATLNDLRDALGTAGDKTQQMAILTGLFGARAAGAVMALLREKGALEEMTVAVSEAGAVNEAFQVQMEGTANQLTIAKNKTEAAKMAMAEAMAPAEIYLAEVTAELYNKFSELNPELTKTIGVAGLLTGKLAQMLSPVMMLIPAIMSMRSAHAAATAAKAAHGVATVSLTATQWAYNIALYACPLFLIIGLVVLLYYAYQNKEKILKKLSITAGKFNKILDKGRKAYNDYQKSVDKVKQAVLEFLKPVLEPLKKIFEAIIGIIINIARIIKAVLIIAWKAMVETMKPVIKALEPVWKLMKQIGEVVKTVLVKEFERLKKIWKDITDFIRRLFKPILDAVNKAIAILGGWLQKIADWLGSVKDKLGGVADQLEGMAGGSSLLDFNEAWGDFLNKAPKIQRELANMNRVLSAQHINLVNSAKPIEAHATTLRQAPAMGAQNITNYNRNQEVAPTINLISRAIDATDPETYRRLKGLVKRVMAEELI